MHYENIYEPLKSLYNSCPRGGSLYEWNYILYRIQGKILNYSNKKPLLLKPLEQINKPKKKTLVICDTDISMPNVFQSGIISLHHLVASPHVSVSDMAPLQCDFRNQFRSLEDKTQ